jgi:hypothetical protein
MGIITNIGSDIATDRTSGNQRQERIMERADIELAIDAHGAKTVYEAAYRHMGGAKSLADVGLTPSNMGEVDFAMTVAYEHLSEAQRAIDYADATSKLATLNDK